MQAHPSHKFRNHYCVHCRCLDVGRGDTWLECPKSIIGRVDWGTITREVVEGRTPAPAFAQQT